MAVNIVIDIILIGIVATFAIIGAVKGLFHTIAKPVRFFLALFLAFQLAEWFSVSIVEPIIGAPLSNQLVAYLENAFSGIETISFEELPTLIRLAVGLMNIDVPDTIDTHEFLTDLINKLTGPAIHIVSIIISFVFLYFVLKLILWIVFSILNQMFDTGVVGVVNRIFGFVFNTAFGFIVAWGLVVVFGYVVSLPVIAETSWGDQFTGGFVYGFLKDLSPLDLLLSF